MSGMPLISFPCRCYALSFCVRIYCSTCSLLLSLTVTAQQDGFHKGPPQRSFFRSGCLMNSHLARFPFMIFIMSGNKVILQRADISFTICKIIFHRKIIVFFHVKMIPNKRGNCQQSYRTHVLFVSSAFSSVF